MKKSAKQLLSLVLSAALCVSLMAGTAFAADTQSASGSMAFDSTASVTRDYGAWTNDAEGLSVMKPLLNSQELHPQVTGYEEFDAILEDLFAPYEGCDTYTKVKFAYDWVTTQVQYSWDGYSQTWAPAYDKFTLSYDLTYDKTLKEAIPKEIINRTYHSLTEKLGICYDYGALFAVMVRYIGLNAYVHTGYFTFEPYTGSGHHGWAEVTLNGINYIFDPQREYRLSSNGTSTIYYYYFGINTATSSAWRYYQDTADNAARDAGFLSVTADRQKKPAAEGEDEVGANDTPATAVSMRAGTSVKGRLSSKKDVDCYAFTLSEAAYVQMKVTHNASSSSAVNWKFALYSSDDELISSLNVRGNNVSAFGSKVGLAPGDYYIVVSKGSRYSSAAYTMRLGYALVSGWEQEDNDTKKSAMTLKQGKAATGSISCVSDVDYYKCRLSAAGTLTLALTHTARSYTGSYYRVTVYDAHGKKAASYTVKGNAAKRTKKLDLSAGTYYIRVEKGQRYYGGLYSLTASAA